MEKTLAKLRAKEPVTIVVVGDSCWLETPWTYGRKNWVSYLHEALWAAYGDGLVTMINQSRCGNSFESELKIMDRSILRFSPDLVILGLIVRGDTEEERETSRTQAREMAGRIRERGGEILFATHTPVVYGFWKGTPATARPGEAFPDAPSRGAVHARALVELAGELGCPVVDHYAAWAGHTVPYAHLGAHPQGLWMRVIDTVHPGPTGHLAVFRATAPFFKVSAYFPWEEVPLAMGPGGIVPDRDRL